MPRKPIDYSKTVIYKIVCNDLNITDCYVGHTTNFTERKYNHRYNTENETVKYHYLLYVTIRNYSGWNNWSMLEIEEFPCKNLNQAKARERYWIETLSSNLNMTIPLRTDKENYKQNKNIYAKKSKIYYNENKQVVLDYQKDYYNENKQDILDYQTQYRNNNKEKISQYKTEYCILNKEKLSQKNKEKYKNMGNYTCICGSILHKHSKLTHEKTPKHLKFTQTILCQALPLNHA